MYDPKTKKYPFPEDTGSHYIILKENVGTVFDTDYPYYDHSKKMKRKQAFTRFLLHLIVFPICRIRLGLRIHGKKNIKEHAELLKKGVVSCSNHVHFWDFIAIMDAVKPFKPYVLVWAENVRGENRHLIRKVRGVPIPDSGFHALNVMSQETKKHIEDGAWVHVYAEGSMWEYYMPVRPFKDGASFYSASCDKPIVPLGFSYRRPGWIRRIIFKQIALFDLHIGEPLFPNHSLPFEERKTDLVKRSHAAVCRLCGIDPEDNLYPPVYDHSTRVDYY